MKYPFPKKSNCLTCVGFCCLLITFYLSEIKAIAAPETAGLNPTAAFRISVERGDCAFATSQANQVLSRYPYGTAEAAQANLAIGTCLLRAKLWSAAHRALRLAQPLSGRSAATRRRLEKYAIEREREEAKALAVAASKKLPPPTASRPVWQAPVQVTMPVEPTYGKIQQRPPSVPVKVPKAVVVGSSFSITPELTYNRIDSSKSCSGLLQSNGSALTTENKVTVKAQTSYPMPNVPNEPLTFSLPVELNLTTGTTLGENVDFRRTSDTATTVFGTVSETGNSSKDFITTASPAVELPLMSAVGLKGSYKYSLKSPDFKSKGQETTRSPKGELTIKSGSVTSKTSVAYLETLDESGGRKKSDMVYNGNASYNVGAQTFAVDVSRTETDVPEALRDTGVAAANSNVSLSGKHTADSGEYKLKGTYVSFERFLGIELKSPARNLKLAGEVTVPFSVFSLGANAAYSSQSDFVQGYTIKDESGGDLTIQITAEDTVMEFGGKFEVTAVKWLAISIGYSYKTISYKTNNPLAEKDFLKKNADLIMSTTISASLSREF